MKTHIKTNAWRTLTFALPVLAAVLLIVASPAHAITADQVKEKVAADFGVEVLKVEPIQEGGKSRFRVHVMNPGGDYNTAFQVNTLIVDAATGELVQQFQHKTTGYQKAPGAATYDPNRQSADALRDTIWR